MPPNSLWIDPKLMPSNSLWADPKLDETKNKICTLSLTICSRYQAHNYDKNLHPEFNNLPRNCKQTIPRKPES
jgi:hypothetical protein